MSNQTMITPHCIQFTVLVLALFSWNANVFGEPPATVSNPIAFNLNGADAAQKYSGDAYPWKTAIVSTVFSIGRAPRRNGGSNNYDGAWAGARGIEYPDDPAYAYNDANLLNPFYVALPFNDLAYPEKARHWLPARWYAVPHPSGKSVSVCKNRWVEIKTQDGRICFGQWEDVGPVRDDNAEYVFGMKRPSAHAGLGISPAIAKYLHLSSDDITSWRFVNDEDIPPGIWLKFEERTLYVLPSPH